MLPGQFEVGLKWNCFLDNSFSKQFWIYVFEEVQLLHGHTKTLEPTLRLIKFLHSNQNWVKIVLTMEGANIKKFTTFLFTLSNIEFFSSSICLVCMLVIRNWKSSLEIGFSKLIKGSEFCFSLWPYSTQWIGNKKVIILFCTENKIHSSQEIWNSKRILLFWTRFRSCG